MRAGRPQAERVVERARHRPAAARTRFARRGRHLPELHGGHKNTIGTGDEIYTELNEGKKISKFNLLKTWVVRQFQNEYNPTHWHGGHISGAGFLKVPKSLGQSTQQKKSKKYRGGNLQLIHGARMFTCPSTFNITPEVGDFYLFPNYLMHTVFPFKGTDEERRSISFNASIDEDIYNVYGK